MYAIYALIDPRDNAVRYVGVTNDVYKRFLSHIQCSGNNLAKNLWITELRAANKMVIMKTLEEVEGRSHALAREYYWIQHFQILREPLVNIHQMVSVRTAKNGAAEKAGGEETGKENKENTQDQAFVLKRLLNSAGKMRAEGASIDAILKAHGLTPGGRNNQNLKALLDGQDQAANE